MSDWYDIGVTVGVGTALGVLFVALLTSLHFGQLVSIVLAIAGAVVIGWFVNGWTGVGGGIIGAVLGVLGAALVVRGALSRGGTAGGTAFIALAAAIALAALALIPVVGYVIAVVVPALGLRAWRRTPRRYAGLRTLAK